MAPNRCSSCAEATPTPTRARSTSLAKRAVWRGHRRSLASVSRRFQLSNSQKWGQTCRTRRHRNLSDSRNYRPKTRRFKSSLPMTDRSRARASPRTSGRRSSLQTRSGRCRPPDRRGIPASENPHKKPTPRFAAVVFIRRLRSSCAEASRRSSRSILLGLRQPVTYPSYCRLCAVAGRVRIRGAMTSTNSGELPRPGRLTTARRKSLVIDLLSQGHTRAQVREALGINRVTVYRWRQAKCSPKRTRMRWRRALT
jgi:Homeodomain-like domain